ncbi:MAG: hypothetical protein HS130_02885 [Deltaproteobacteria bacterium]|nr:hypothetical protein [Deltaproteobacteria bacterium]MCL4874966.1 hypothetical protein [bacterium]
MKRYLILAVAAASAGLIAMSVSEAATNFATDFQDGTSASGIGKSRHNLGALGGPMRTNSTTEICVFCHTPHHSNVDGFAANEKVPLWNRTNSTNAYTPYGTTVAGTMVAQVGGGTLACLSCHDGVTTFDNLVNAPGKGLNTGRQYWKFAMGVDGAGNNEDPWAGSGRYRSALGCSGGSCHKNAGDWSYGDDYIGRLNIGGRTGESGGRGFGTIYGEGLSNDHPVSITYYGSDHVDGGKASLRDSSTPLASIDLASDVWSTSHAAVQADGNLTQNRWAVNGFITNNATIGDLLRNNKVECTSCHDPHFKNTSWDEVKSTWVSDGSDWYTYTNDYSETKWMQWTSWCGNDGEKCSDGQFLRRVGGNTGSGVCKTCHNK